VGNGAYMLVFDGSNGRMPAFAYTDKYRGVDSLGGCLCHRLPEH
jgi:hypothetical protein